MTIGSLGENLIFLISQPRAGSTLLQRLLAGDPSIHTTAEPWILLHPVYAMRKQGHTAEYNADLAYFATQEFCRSLPNGQEEYYNSLRLMACHLYNKACGTTPDKLIFLDKTPRYYHIIPELNHLFPKAKYIFLLRNPVAVLASILKTLVKEDWLLLPRYRHDLLSAPKFIDQGIKLLDNKAIIIHYEKLATEPENVMLSLCHKLGLEYSSSMLDYGQRQAPVGQMGDHTQISRKQRPSSDSVERWLELGKNQQTRHFAEQYISELGGVLLHDLGYDIKQLRHKLNQVDVVNGSITVTWEQLFRPTEEMQRRLALIELALIEHRRIVRTIKQVLHLR